MFDNYYQLIFQSMQLAERYERERLTFIDNVRLSTHGFSLSGLLFNYRHHDCP